MENTSLTIDHDQLHVPHLQGYKIFSAGIYYFWGFIIPFGVFANVINILVFTSSEVKDNVTISLVFLAMSDFLFLVLISPNACITGILYFRPAYLLSLPFDFQIVHVLSYYYGFLFYDISIAINVVLSVIKCACVSMPLRFKNSFTRNRTIFVILVMVGVNIATHSPLLHTFKVDIGLNPLTNSTYLKLFKITNVAQRTTVNNILNRNIYPFASFVIVTTCFIVMALELFRASKFRSSFGNANAMGGISVDVSDEFKKERNQQNSPPQLEHTKSDRLANTAHKMSNRDTRLLQSVLLVGAIFILCQLPFVCYTLARHFDPEFNNSFSGEKVYLYLISAQVSSTFGYMNSSINIIVYYRYNSRFKKNLHETIAGFCKRRK